MYREGQLSKKSKHTFCILHFHSKNELLYVWMWPSFHWNKAENMEFWVCVYLQKMKTREDICNHSVYSSAFYLFIFQVLKLFICIIKKLCIPIIKIIWTTTTTKLALWLNCILQPAEHLGPAFYSRFHCRPTQLPPSPTCKFFSFPASHTGRWERQARPTLSVVLHSLMWKGVAQSFKLDPTSLHLTKLNS